MVRKSIVAAILSLIIPGLGHAWPLGQILRGAMWFFLAIIVSVVVFVVGWVTSFPVYYISWVGWIVSFIAAYDAYTIGEKKFKGQQI